MSGVAASLGIVAAIAFGIQWIVFIHAYTYTTEKYYDFTGSITYITCMVMSLVLSQTYVGNDITAQPRRIIVAVMCICWAMRLGSFLYARIKKDGKDGRFDQWKESFVGFFIVWNMQGLWVVLTAMSAFIIILSDSDRDFNVTDGVGIAVWAIGWGIEVVADNQKKAWRELPTSKGKWIDVGLWSISRHPNYFGEWVLWCGITIIGAGIFEGWQWVGFISPVFVFYLLRFVSGVPLLEKGGDKKWGKDPDYIAYKERTSVFAIAPACLSPFCQLWGFEEVFDDTEDGTGESLSVAENQT